MDLVFTLPNGKEAITEKFCYKHIEELLQDTSTSNKVSILEKFIKTKGLNVIEKFIALLKLREKCIGTAITLTIDQKAADVDIEVLLQSFQEIINIRQRKTIDNITLILDYPKRFCVDTDNILSVIHEIHLEDEKINLNNVTNNEFLQITNSLPAEALNLIYEFVKEKKDALTYSLLGKVDLNFLDQSPVIFLNNIYRCIDDYRFREYLFILSKRIKDVNFLLNSTFFDIVDYMELYRRESEEHNQKLKK